MESNVVRKLDGRKEKGYNSAGMKYNLQIRRRAIWAAELIEKGVCL